MKPITILLFSLLLSGSASALDVSLKLETEQAVENGLKFLARTQNEAGWWSKEDLPAITALALTAFNGHAGGVAAGRPESLQKGYAYLLKHQQQDGGIYLQRYANYNTAVSMMALLTSRNPAFEPALRRARSFLVGLQYDIGEPGKIDSPFDGGVGYGSHYPHSDLNNTLLALEAVHYSRHLVADKGAADGKDLDWAAAINFLQNCQNLPSHNSATNLSTDAANLGGFFYYPGVSKAGNVTNSVTGRVSLRSYGSASYAGLLSYIYADLKQDDPRVKAVLQWLGDNYTLAENPGMGQQGLFYYFQLITKALNTAGRDHLETSDGRRIEWRSDVAKRLLNLQQADGSWTNPTSRWMESDPVLVTSYCLITLEMLLRD